MADGYLVGIDIGTSACKIAVFTHDGEIVYSRTEEYPVYYPAPGLVEQDPEDWWKAVCRGMKQTVANSNIKPDAITGIGIDGQSWSAVMVSSDGEVLARNPIWMDTRAAEICRELNDKIGADNIFKLSGNPLKPQYTTGKIVWFKQNMPEVYAQTDKVLQSNSFIVYRMTGVMSQDVSQGYGIHSFDMRGAKWNIDSGSALGIDNGKLPDIAPSHEMVGRLTAKAAQQTGLVAGIPVVAGGLDAACGTLGAGVIHPGQTQEQGGQAGGMSICIDDYCADPRMIMGFHVVPGRWLLQGGTTGGGGVLKWFHEQFGYEEDQQAKASGESALTLLCNLAEAVPAGSDGLVFLPYMAGERSPIWDEKAKGVYYGLDYSKTKAHMVRASLESVAFALKHNLDTAAGAGAEVQTLRATGGSANSKIWTQIKADITGKEIEVPASDMATTLGAAILAGVGLKVFKNFDEAVEKTVRVKRRHTPNIADKAAYEKAYATYLSLYRMLKPLMNQ